MEKKSLDIKDTGPSVPRKKPKHDVEATLQEEQLTGDPKSVPGICSSMPLSGWKGSVTTFNGFTGTQPDQEIREEGWPTIRNLICPPGPTALKDKTKAKYVVPCLLKNAQLVGKTLEAAETNGTETVGKMRSKGHVTEASFLFIDADGLPEGEFSELLGKMQVDNLTFSAYTTYSHGDPEKPGIRVRIAIPVDRPLSSDEYSTACIGFVKQFFADKCDAIDSSGFKMYQQGTWCCDTSRVEKAESWANDGGVLSAVFLLEKATTATIVFFLILSLVVRYGIYVLAVVAIYIAVRLMKDEG